ncbi:ESPR-type extended signal peptide-containing protein, partial [Comamonas sp.]|uniref:ESPR-type extended signal peptide-containing protein n=1 Tax=Comamonas sp. TaxID=34028 RepID=UPI0028A2ABF0
MNHIYRSIWNATLGCWMAAPETACEGCASCRNVRSRVEPRLVGMPSTWTVLAAALFLWLGGMEAVCAQTINVLGNENKSVPTDYSAGPYSGGSIAKGGTLTVNAGNTLTLNSGFTLNNSGTLNINGALNNAGEIKGTVQGLQPSAVIRNDSGGKIIASSAHGIDLKAGGLVSNIGSGSVIQTSGGFGKAAVYIDGAAGTVNNLSGASINSTSYLGNGVFLGLGGAVLNDGIGSSISAKGGGVGIQGRVGRVDNTGGARITSDGVFGVQLEAGGTVLNHGQGSTISAAGTLSTGVNFLNSSGSLVNTEGAVINTLGKGRLGVNLGQGGSVFNGEGSSIYGTFASVQSSGNTTLTNAGNLFGDVDLNATSQNEVHLWSGAQIKGDLKIGSNAASTLTLEGSGQQLYSDAVSGVTTFAGVLRMAGTGRWVLDQVLNSVNTIIDSGTLEVAHNNALGSGEVNVGDTGTLQVNSGFTLENELNLSAGGTLSGTGTVGIASSPTTVESGAAIRGGDSDTTYGTLTVAGNLDMKAGAILQVRVDPSSNQASLVNVVGTATLTGSTVQHVGNVVNAASDF